MLDEDVEETAYLVRGEARPSGSHDGFDLSDGARSIEQARENPGRPAASESARHLPVEIVVRDARRRGLEDRLPGDDQLTELNTARAESVDHLARRTGCDASSDGTEAQQLGRMAMEGARRDLDAAGPATAIGELRQRPHGAIGKEPEHFGSRSLQLLGARGHQRRSRPRWPIFPSSCWT
jgi:hypothetical protein